MDGRAGFSVQGRGKNRIVSEYISHSLRVEWDSMLQPFVGIAAPAGGGSYDQAQN